MRFLITGPAWASLGSLCTSLCLQWEPKAVAVAFLYLGGKLSNFDLQAATQSRSRSWWRNFVDTVDIHDLEAICHLVLDVYTEGKDTKPEVSSIRSSYCVCESSPLPHNCNET